jgi:TolB protein
MNTVTASRLAAPFATALALAACGAPTDPGADAPVEIVYWGGVPSGIYLSNADGSNARLIAPTDGNLDCLSWSPDGRRIAFAQTLDQETYQIWLTDVETKVQTPLTVGPNEHTCPSWSPDGTRIAYFFRSSGQSGYLVRTMKPDGSDDKPLSSVSVSSDKAAWSPDGKRIAVTTADRFPQVALIDVVTGAIGAPLTPVNTEWNGAPAWSPDGTMIAYGAERDGPYAIYVMNVDGTAQRPVTPPGPFPLGGGNWPTWSPDGHWLAYEDHPNGFGGPTQVMASMLDGSQTYLVAAGAGQPAWRPSSR